MDGMVGLEKGGNELTLSKWQTKQLTGLSGKNAERLDQPPTQNADGTSTPYPPLPALIVTLIDKNLFSVEA